MIMGAAVKQRGGRPRRVGVDRYDNGRIRDDPSKLPAWNKARDLYRSLGMAHRLSTQRGKLFCMGQITDKEFEAGNRWSDMLEGYDRLILGRNRSPASPALERMGHGESSGHDPERIERFKEAFASAHKALLIGGKVVEAAVNRLCRDEAAGAMMAEARRGLGLLAVHYGLVKVKR